MSLGPSECLCRWREVVTLAVMIFPVILTIFVEDQPGQLAPHPGQAGAGVALSPPQLHPQTCLAGLHLTNIYNHVGQTPLVLVLLASNVIILSHLL